LDNENNKGIEVLNSKQKLRLKRITSSIEVIRTIHRRFNSFFEQRRDLVELKRLTSAKLIGKSFLNISGKIIAQSMGNQLLRSDGNYVEFTHLDLINRKFELLDGNSINQDDIANGLASGNYLKQRISNLEGKYIIILLDEIGNMDDKILQEVIQSIKKIEEEGNLVLALLARPGNKGITFNTY
jgi:hypothetical protein